jgi:asparagine synthetase B (glutamine-hydrolysing)
MWAHQSLKGVSQTCTACPKKTGGIFAVYYSSSSVLLPSSDELTALGISLTNIVHRGPDSAGTWVSAYLRAGESDPCTCTFTIPPMLYLFRVRSRFGQVRLSSIDLETGQQPLSDKDGLIHCIVTGEIYEHSGYVRNWKHRAPSSSPSRTWKSWGICT